MSIILEAQYSKKLGLPQYSSHSYQITVRTELTDLTQVHAESARLYELLQKAVDHEIQNSGFLPSGATHVQALPLPAVSGPTSKPHVLALHDAGHDLSHQSAGRGQEVRHTEARDTAEHSSEWQCSPKQQELILKIVRENRLDIDDIERLSLEMFGRSVSALNRLSASGLIEELIERNPRRGKGSGKPSHSGGGFANSQRSAQRRTEAA